MEKQSHQKASNEVVVRVEDWPMARIHEIFDATFTALGQAISQGKFTPTGPAFARYDAPPTDTATMEIGFPVNNGLTEDIAAGDFTISNSSLPQSRIAITKHRGGYDGLPQAWEDFLAEIHKSGMEFGAPSWEAYDTMPTPETDPADLITGLAVPVTGETE